VKVSDTNKLFEDYNIMAQAKTTKKTEAEPTKALATKTPGGAIVPSYGKQFEGAGWENAGKQDFQIPFLNQLQALSPQCVKGQPEYRNDAEPGMFLNSVTQELYPGEVYLLPALTKHSYVEWKPQSAGGGFVAEHATDSEVVQQAKAEAKSPMELKSKAGNELTETFQVYALILESADAMEVKDQVVISFSRTKIKRYKQILTRLRTFKGSASIPLFAHRLVMGVTDEKNAANQPYKNVTLSPAVNNDVAASLLQADSPLLDIADGFRQAIVGGTARADFSSAKAGVATGTGSDEAADEVFGAEAKK
jgi:hypothetical protein